MKTFEEALATYRGVAGTQEGAVVQDTLEKFKPIFDEISKSTELLTHLSALFTTGFADGPLAVMHRSFLFGVVVGITMEREELPVETTR